MSLFFISFIFISMVGARVLNIIINIFQQNNYSQLSGNSAFRQVALKWFSNTWCKLNVLLYSYGVCASRNNSDKTVHLHRQNIFYCLSIQWVATFHKLVQLFFFVVYIMWCTVIMHIQNWNDSPVTMLKWATIGPPLHSNEWVQLLLLSLLLLPLRVHACMHAGAHARRSQEHGVTHKYTSIFAKRRFTCINTGINDCLCMYAASPEPLLLADT